ncbi:MAG: hypothetical protein AAGL11_11550, partial [Pseudomonadota bacterium]
MRWAVIAATLAATACSDPIVPDPEALFFERLTALCNGEAYKGKLVSEDEVDAHFKKAVMIMGPARCQGSQIDIPFAVGENRSRTWQITRTVDGIRLKHDHRHEDGSEDVVTQYGGDSDDTGAARCQNFPADEETKALFIQEGIKVSTQNTWRVEIDPGETFTYQMSRPERLFRVEFDLNEPVDPPPPSWGESPIE